ncbi:MAG: glycosyltransferase family 117 protein [Gemmatimonadales bacterium]
MTTTQSTVKSPERGVRPGSVPSLQAIEAPPYLMAAGITVGALVLYILTLAPTTQFWDTSEYIAAAYTLGIPHPPGNPLFVVMAHVWGLIPFVESYAQRINLFAAVTSAISAGCWFLVGERWLRSFVPARLPRRLAALAGAIVSATAFTVWNQSVVNEKVYTLSLLSIALILWLIVRWDDQPAGEGHDHYLLLILFLLALTATNHMMGVLVGPVVIILLYPPLKKDRPLSDHARTIEWSQLVVFTSVWALLMSLGLERWEFVAVAGVMFAAALTYAFMAGNATFALAALGVVVVGLSVYAYLPIRAAFYPPINEGEPTNWKALWAVLTREQYGKPSIFDNPTQAPGAGNSGHTLPLYASQLANYWQYFQWQFGHDWSERAQRILAALFAFIGVGGAVRHWLADKRTALAMTFLVFTFTFALVFYLNFKYGFSLHPEMPLAAHEVRQRDYFFICSFAIWGIWVGMGLAAGVEWIGDWFRERQPVEARRWLYGTPLLALALIPLFGNRLTASRKGETLARDFAYDLLQSVEPYGVLVTAGDNDTFPLWYAQEVEGIRRDVTIVNLSLSNTPWYVSQLQRRPVEPFDSTRAPDIYRGRQWPMPAGKLMSFSDEQLNALQPFYVLDGKRVARLGSLDLMLDPQQLGHPYLERADIVVLQIIKDQLGKRPIYFSRTAGLYGDAFGLTSRLEGHGFARVLRQHELQESDSIKAVQSLGYVNLTRTTKLLFDVYHADAAARERPRGWVDEPSKGILDLYGLTYYTMAQELHASNSALSARAQQIAQSIFRNTRLPVQPLPEQTAP